MAAIKPEEPLAGIAGHAMDNVPASPWFYSQVVKVRNMNPKKQHEVALLAPLVARVARASGANAVVDLGSGLGYLSLVLAFHHGLRRTSGIRTEKTAESPGILSSASVPTFS